MHWCENAYSKLKTISNSCSNSCYNVMEPENQHAAAISITLHEGEAWALLGRTVLPEPPELGKRWQMGQKAWHLLSARAESLALPITPSCGKSETLVLFKGH